jgi:hypothetical protein
VRERQQAQLAAQLVVLPLQRGVEREVDAEEPYVDRALAGRLGRGAVVVVDDPLDRPGVAHLGRGLEPDDLAVGLDRRSPGDGALGDHRQPATEGEQQVEVVALDRAGRHRGAG